MDDKNTLATRYLLIGDEPLMLHETIQDIRQKARAQGMDTSLRFHVVAGFNWQSVADSAQTGDLFSAHRLIEIHLYASKLSAEAEKILLHLLHQMTEDVLVISIPKRDNTLSKSNWFSELQQMPVTTISLSPLMLTQIPAWIAKRLEKQGQFVSDAMLTFLAHQTEGNLFATHQEIQKLALLYPARQLTDEEVQSAVLNMAKWDAFQLGSAVLNGDVVRTTHILSFLQAEGEAVASVLPPVLWLFRPLIRLKQAIERGQNLQQAMIALRIFGKQQSEISRAVQKLSMRQLELMLHQLAELDRVAKGIDNQDAWLLLSRLCIGFSKLSKRH